MSSRVIKILLFVRITFVLEIVQEYRIVLTIITWIAKAMVMYSRAMVNVLCPPLFHSNIYI